MKKVAEKILVDGRKRKVAIFKDYFNKEGVEILKDLPEKDIIDFYNKFYYRICKNSHIRCDFRRFKNFLNEFSQSEEEKVAA